MPRITAGPLTPVTPAEPKWRVYEKVIADLEESYPNCTVERNHRVRGRHSDALREVDVWISGRVGRHEVHIAVDCKCYTDPVDVKEIESFLGMVDDIGADKAVLVSTSGFSAAAQRRAQAGKIDIQIIPFDELEDFDFSEYLSDLCQVPGCWGHVQWNELLSPDGGNPTPPMHVAGECDYCSAFHMNCGNCGAVDSYHPRDIIDCSGGCGTSWQLDIEKGDVVGFSVLEHEEVDEG